MTTRADPASGEPRERRRILRLTQPLVRFLHVESASGLVLDQRRAHGAVLLRHWIGDQAGGAGVNGHARPRDKLRALQVLARERVGMPVTGFGNPVAKSPAIEDNKHLVTDQQGATYARGL